MTKSNKQKSLFKRILCGCLTILLLPYHWLYAWFLWTERQREEAESSSNHSSLYDNDIFSEKTSRKAGHDLYDPNDLTNYSNPLSPFYQGHNSTNAPLKEMEETIDPTSLSSINNPDSLYNPKNTSCSAIDDINDPTNPLNYTNPASPYYQGCDLINKNNSIGLGGFYHDNDLFNDPFNDPFSNDFGGGSGSPFDDHF